MIAKGKPARPAPTLTEEQVRCIEEFLGELGKAGNFIAGAAFDALARSQSSESKVSMMKAIFLGCRQVSAGMAIAGTGKAATRRLIKRIHANQAGITE